MMKHNDILKTLDPLRKVALVTSGLTDDGLEQAGVPAVGRVSLDYLAESKGVSYAAAARSFDPALIGRMTKELVLEAAAEGKKLFVTPDLKTAADPYSPGLSEDAGLNGLIGASVAGAVHEAGMAVGLARLSLSERDIAYLDRREDAGAVYDLFVKPFLTASKAACDAVLLTPNRLSSGYPDTNRALFSDVLGGFFGDAFALGDGVAANASALSLLGGKVSLGGAALPLERATRRYAQLKKYREEGSISGRDLEDAIREGSALDDKTLDAAADEVADFAIRLSKLKPAETPSGNGARKKLAAACMTLLKNERVLPLARGTNIAVVGEPYADLSALESRFSVRGRARGYERAAVRSDALIPAAVRAAGSAGVVLVFLWPDMTGRSLSMPANRIALLRALKKTGKRIVGIVCGDTPADLSFDGMLDALLLAPADGPFAAEALARVLTGETDPAGRLARTAYDGADAYFSGLAEARDEGKLRIGGFVGYLRYDTARESVRYPFGFGLSYTKFSYSGLTVKGDEISFTVKNTGSRPGYEVAQIYVGAPAETTFGPVKRLKAVYKSALKPGESKRATVTLTADDYATYDTRTLSDSVETGVYRIYVCSDALTVKLQGKRTLEGVAREPSGIEPADYFPDGPYLRNESLKPANRVGTAERNKVPKALKNVRRAALCVFPVIAILFFLLLTVFIFATAVDSSLFALFDRSAVVWSVYGLAVLMLALIPLLGSLNRRRLARVRTGSLIVCLPLLFACLILGILLMTERDIEDELIIMSVVSCFAVGAPIMAIVAAIAEHVLEKSKSGANRWQKYYFSQQREETMLSDAEFEEAFRTAAASPAPEEPESPAPEEPMQFFDKDLSYEELLRDGSLFVKERGFDAAPDTMKNVFAALSASQLLIVPEGMGAALMGAVAEYLGKRPYIDNAELYAQSDDLFTQWKQGDRMYRRTELSAAFDDAAQDSAFLHIAILRHAAASRLAQTLGPLAEVLSRRRAAMPVPGGEERIIPPNLCIVAEVGEGDIGKLPPAIAETASILLPHCNACPPAERKSVVQSVGFDRFAAMKRAVRDEHPLGEETWKNVDLLDERCRSAHVGNLVWVKTEIHASVLSACGENDGRAADGALASELLPWMYEVWNDGLCGGKLADALAEIFGKNMEFCREYTDARGDGAAKR